METAAGGRGRGPGLVGLLSGTVDHRAAWADLLLERTGTRLVDWVDHLALPPDQQWQGRLQETGFVPHRQPHEAGWDDALVWKHPAGLFPAIVIHDQPVWRLALKVEAVADFLAAGRLGSAAAVEGVAAGPFRRARVSRESSGRLGGPRVTECWAVERHGYRGWNVPEVPPETLAAAFFHGQAFRNRRRSFAHAEDGFDETAALIGHALADLGPGWAADLFFAAERDYWTGRNRAGQVQKARQDALGLGWGNHDHHTYRSSRRHLRG